LTGLPEDSTFRPLGPPRGSPASPWQKADNRDRPKVWTNLSKKKPGPFLRSRVFLFR
jgi:hypothetical protein